MKWWLVRLVWRCYGASLVVAGLLKSLAPWVAAAAMRWTGLDMQMRVRLTVAACVVEVFVGTLIVLAIRRGVVLTGVAGGVLMLTAHLARLGGAAVGSCGCFGEYSVGESELLVWVGAGIGAGGALLMHGRSSQPVGRWVLVAAAGLAMSSLLLGLTGWSTPRDALRQFVMAASPPRAGFGLVGSARCDECVGVLRSIGAQIDQGRFPYDAVMLIVRTGESTDDIAALLGREASWVLPLEVPDDLWWKWIADAPPTLVHWDASQQPEVLARIPVQSNPGK